MIPVIWSVRMRASRRRAHISGAEGLYGRREIVRAARAYIERALAHPKGSPDEIVMTVEAVKSRPKSVTALPLRTLRCGSPPEAKKHSIKILSALDISEDALKSAFDALSGRPMRGAALVDMNSGERLDADRTRGVRVSRLGIGGDIKSALSRRLGRLGLNTDTVKEALVLASKVSSHPAIAAEICVSDDPDYTTGYIASKRLGYLRIPNIKKKGSKKGGRVFFVNSGADMKSLMNYLEKRPVIIASLPAFGGEVIIDEVLDSLNR